MINRVLSLVRAGYLRFFAVAKHTITGHTVAMKFLSKEVIHREKTKSRVQREVEYMRALRHPHIIKLYV